MHVAEHLHPQAQDSSKDSLEAHKQAFSTTGTSGVAIVMGSAFVSIVHLPLWGPVP